jgi:pimeloyl-ACP methyl ester carboxylesterase
MCKVAYVEHGRGPVVLFLHGFPLNSYQWRGALERLHEHRRCIAPDFMSLGSTETPAGQEISPDTQVSMLASFLDALHIKSVDLVANDSGGMVAQVFVARHPHRVRTLLLTNCDVDTNNPPENFVPAVELAKKGLFAEKFLLPQVKDRQLARSGKAMIGSAYTYPDRLSDETIAIYFDPLVESKLRMSQVDQYTVSLGKNELVGLREDLRKWSGPARMVWGVSDRFFPMQWADWLDTHLANSKGVRRIESANLFFPEEMPDIIAEEAKTLWGVS